MSSFTTIFKMYPQVMSHDFINKFTALMIRVNVVYTYNKAFKTPWLSLKTQQYLSRLWFESFNHMQLSMTDCMLIRAKLRFYVLTPAILQIRGILNFFLSEEYRIYNRQLPKGYYEPYKKGKQVFSLLQKAWKSLINTKLRVFIFNVEFRDIIFNRDL